MIRYLPHAAVAVCVFVAILLSPPIDGHATHYAPGLFERVALARGLPPAECYIASDWHPLGAQVLVSNGLLGIRL